MTRNSTPKYEVVHYMGAVARTGISKTDAIKIARAMNKGGPKDRFSVQKVKIAIRFQGFKISQNESGFFWQEGGYHDTLAECQAEIAEHNSDLHSDENVHGLASIQQSIEEDRKKS